MDLVLIPLLIIALAALLSFWAWAVWWIGQAPKEDLKDVIHDLEPEPTPLMRRLTERCRAE